MAKNSTLGFIPAKGGSTRLARKNVRNLGGKSLIAWAAEAAWDSGVIDRLVLSTEDEAIADQARALGIDVPFMRPPELARDPAEADDVALHALEALEDAGDTYETIVILLPTCPFRSAEDVRGAYELFTERDRPFVMSVAEFSHTPFAAFQMDAGAGLTPMFQQYLEQPTKTLPKVFRPNGAVHVLDVKAFRTAGSYLAQPLVGYVMPRERSFDIDNEEDFREAEIHLAMAAERAAAAGNESP
ncbi:acylneuraminate cytidylyltransferase family protein [Pelagibius litoralis]|uniref:Acylneuraminate cytidylyltransferase family protein n=1 Tax=Pelagibius litoralis TaxID=374515 RepID=A0A967C927_9PROT|nr:acylneuraminate cytidylyltransferase family protein [Pelagibius litoralis]NIA69027.1 acylneuraminate cytidylyltransferase family protein [Pelagibius litoralis]